MLDLTSTATLTIVTKSGSVYVFTSENCDATHYTLHVVKGHGYEGHEAPNVRIITPRIGERCSVTDAADGSHVMLTSPVTHILRTNVLGETLPSDPYSTSSVPVSGDEMDVARMEWLANG